MNKFKGCKQSQMQLKMVFCKTVEQKFDGGDVCSDGGLLMLRKAEKRLHLTELAAFCLGDKRRPDLIRHNLQDLFRQRVYAIAAQMTRKSKRKESFTEHKRNTIELSKKLKAQMHNTNAPMQATETLKLLSKTPRHL